MLLLALYMPGLDGRAVLAAVHDTPHLPAVVVLTSAADDEHVVRAVHVGRRWTRCRRANATCSS